MCVRRSTVSRGWPLVAARGGGAGCDGPGAHGRDVVPRGRVRLVPAVDRAVVHGQSRRGRVRGVVGAFDPGGRCLLDGGGEDAVTGLDVVLAVAGAVATLLVIAGMILITPRGGVDTAQEAPNAQGTDLSRAGVAEASARASNA